MKRPAVRKNKLAQFRNKIMINKKLRRVKLLCFGNGKDIIGKRERDRERVLVVGPAMVPRFKGVKG